MNSNNKPKFIFLTRPNGHNEFLEFLKSLPVKDRKKMIFVINNVQSEGLLIAQQQHWVKKVDDNLFELRSKSGKNIQRGLYFHVVNNEFVVTHGFTE